MAHLTFTVLSRGPSEKMPANWEEDPCRPMCIFLYIHERRKPNYSYAYALSQVIMGNISSFTKYKNHKSSHIFHFGPLSLEHWTRLRPEGS